MKTPCLSTTRLLVSLLAVIAVACAIAGDGPEGSLSYDAFESDDICAECHGDIARQHAQAMMAQSFTHHWDEIEYFELALPHALKEEKVAGVKAGCNGCHAPLAFLAGDIPPKRPAEGTRANEGVSCDVCHSITGFDGDVPFNFNFVIAPGETKQGVRNGTESPHHEIAANPFLMTAEFCGICHNEKDPWDQWVKATHLEWQKSPQAKAGIVCQDCHMPPAAGNSAPETGGADHPDVRQHLFHGAHDTNKLMGAVEVRIHPSNDDRQARQRNRLVSDRGQRQGRPHDPVRLGGGACRLAACRGGRCCRPAPPPVGGCQGLRGRGAIPSPPPTPWPTRTSATSRGWRTSRASSETVRFPPATGSSGSPTSTRRGG